MSSLLIYMVKYCIGFSFLELHPLKDALTNLSQFYRLSPYIVLFYVISLYSLHFHQEVGACSDRKYNWGKMDS